MQESMISFIGDNLEIDEVRPITSTQAGVGKGL
jgi:hypothetical protein